MPRKSLRPELNRIRGWVRQGRTDAWIAHQLEVTVQQIQTFKREQSLEADADGTDPDVPLAADFDDEIDLRAEDDALIAAELDAEAEARAIAEREAAEQAAADAAAKAAARAAAGEEDSGEDDDPDKPKRRRGRRGGRSTRRKKPVGPLEGTFDHGEEGYGLWLDPSVQDDPVYAEYWAGHRSVEVIVEEDQIIIRRVVSDAEGEADDVEESPTPSGKASASEEAPASEAAEEAPASEGAGESEAQAETAGRHEPTESAPGAAADAAESSAQAAVAEETDEPSPGEEAAAPEGTAAEEADGA